MMREGTADAGRFCHPESVAEHKQGACVAIATQGLDLLAVGWPERKLAEIQTKALGR